MSLLPKYVASLMSASFLICCFFACKKETTTPQSPIVGAWRFNYYSAHYYNNNVDSYDDTGFFSPDASESVWFYSNGTYTNYLSSAIGLDSLTGNFRIASSILSFSNLKSSSSLSPPPSDPLLYARVADNPAPFAVHVMLITADSLVLHTEVVDSIFVNGAGFTSNKQVFDEHFSRIKF